MSGFFLSRQRADFEDLGCPRAPQARFAREDLQTRVARKSVIGEVFWVALGSPRGVPELCWLSWAALGCSGLLLVAAGRPQPSHQRAPESNPTMTTNRGRLPLNLALHREFSKQPGVHHQMRLT